MIACHHCANELPDGARFCDNCGTPVPQPDGGPAPATSTEPAGSAASTNTLWATIKGANTTVIATAVVVIVMIAIGAYVLTRGSDDTVLTTSGDPAATSATTPVVTTPIDPASTPASTPTISTPATTPTSTPPAPTVSPTTATPATTTPPPTAPPTTAPPATTTPPTAPPTTVAPPTTAPPPTIPPGPTLPALSQSCRNEIEGYALAYPDAWFTDDAGLPEFTCSFFDPAPFVIDLDTEFPIVAVNSWMAYTDLDTLLLDAYDPTYATITVGPIEVEIAGHPAIIIELQHTGDFYFDAGTLTYEIWMDVGGRTFVLYTIGPGPDYEPNRQIIDMIAWSLVMDP